MNISSKIHVLFVISSLALTACSSAPQKATGSVDLIKTRLPQTTASTNKLNTTNKMQKECAGVAEGHKNYYHCAEREKNANKALEREERVVLKKSKEG
tara:strand:+ start:7047 stop:7340 length:294 start_codon:yes stop_codon:yes gene_type:complete